MGKSRGDGSGRFKRRKTERRRIDAPKKIKGKRGRLQKKKKKKKDESHGRAACNGCSSVTSRTRFDLQDGESSAKENLLDNACQGETV
jgi:hypothetical protein